MSASKDHPFKGKKAYFATMHGKEEILKPLFFELGIECVSGLIDTDKLGTFSGEVERVGSVMDTLKKKIHICSQTYPEAELIVASEGTFGPHPTFGLIETDLESLLIWDRFNKTVLYADYLDLNPLVAEEVFSSFEEAQFFLDRVNLLKNGVIVHPQNSFSPIFKGLHDEENVASAMAKCFLNSLSSNVLIKTDLRACHNSRRREAIYEAGKNLIKKLRSLCPRCFYPGFDVSETIPGLECDECGAPTHLAEKFIFTCNSCRMVEERPRPDGKKYADPGYCDFCNP